MSKADPRASQVHLAFFMGCFEGHQNKCHRCYAHDEERNLGHISNECVRCISSSPARKNSPVCVTSCRSTTLHTSTAELTSIHRRLKNRRAVKRMGGMLFAMIASCVARTLVCTAWAKISWKSSKPVLKTRETNITLCNFLFFLLKAFYHEKFGHIHCQKVADKDWNRYIKADSTIFACSCGNWQESQSWCCDSLHTALQVCPKELYSIILLKQHHSMLQCNMSELNFLFPLLYWHSLHLFPLSHPAFISSITFKLAVHIDTL